MKRIALGLIGGLVLGGGLLLSVPWTATGTRAALSLVPGLNTEGVQGPLVGPFQAHRLSYALSASQTLVLEDLSWDAWQLSLSTWRLPRLHLGRLALSGSAAPSTTPTVLPQRIVLPWTIRVDQVGIDRIDLPAFGEGPVKNLRGTLVLTGQGDGEHRLDGLVADWTHWHLHGQARLQAAPPLRLSAQLGAAPLADIRPAGTGPTPEVPVEKASPALPADTRLELQAEGPLARLNLQARFSAAQQSLTAQAELRLEDPLPVSRLQVQAQSLDLAALAPSLPRTALSGRLDAEGAAAAPGTSAPRLAVQAQLDNAEAGPWDTQRRIPVRRLRLQASSQTDHPERGQLDALTMDLGSTELAAGSIRGQGNWQCDSVQRNVLALNLTLQDVEPARLSPQAPALKLSGPIAVRRTMAEPDGAPPASAASTAASTNTLKGAKTSKASSGWPLALGEQWTLEAALRGQTTAGPTRTAASSGSRRRSATPPPTPALPAPVDVTLKARADARGLIVETLKAAAGAAHLDAQLSLAQAPSEETAPNTSAPRPWQARAQATLQRFDPGLWWPALGVHGVSDLHAKLNVDLQAPANLPSLSGPQAVDALQQALTGKVQLDLQPSRLWGVPSQGAVDMNRETVQAVWHGSARLQAATHHRLQAKLQTDPGLNAVQAEASIDSPGLQQLAPWWAALGLTESPSGNLKVDARAQRRDGLWSTQGRIDSEQLRWNRSDEVQALQGRWSLHEASASPFEVQVQARSVHVSGVALNGLNVSGQGRTDRHRLEATVDLAQTTAPPAQAPTAAAPPTAPVSNTRAPSSTRAPVRATLRAEGGWTHRGERQAWQGRIEHLQAQAQRGKGREPWIAQLAPTPLRWERVQRSESVRTAADLGATQLQVADARLLVDTLQWSSDTPTETGTAPPSVPQQRLRAVARLEPMAIAPWLQELQPDFGWSGDLKVSGRLDFDGTPQRVRGHASLKRDQGDLTVIDPTGAGARALQSLGLSELALVVEADEGRWRLTQRVAGRNLGSLQGEQSIQAPPQALVPPDSSALTGQIRLQMAELGHWGNWLPAGWRMSGQVQGQASVAGTVGAPEFSGLVEGQGLAVRNLLEGIDWSDARLRLALKGPKARLEQFSVKAGSGRIEAQGDVALGANPAATLDLKADRFAVLQRVDRRVVASGQARLYMDNQRTDLTGRLRADEGRIDFSRSDAPSLGDDVNVQRPGTPSRRDATGSDPERPQRALNLDLVANLGNQFNLVGRGLRTRLEGELRLTSPNNRLTLQGDIRAVDGTYAAYAQKLTLERGLISFTGIPDNPRLDILALRPDLEDQQAGVAITGTAQNPRIRLYSEPSLTDTETLSWLILGRAPDGLGRTDLALLQRAAFALLSGESDSPSLIERVGLDQLSVRQSEGDTKETVVAVGKQISRRWFLGYERSLNAETGTWQLVYRLAKRFTLRAQSGADNALDVIWTWKWGTDQRTPAAPPAVRPASAP